ncbi:hypothetical protein FQR65_LT18880 [Abscondita terminalis]|nr:hypothetical protein FQR65_LT18880 [Abscondita terminalis]
MLLVALTLTHAEVVKNTADFFPDINGNVSSITWAHAVNSQALLSAALNDSTMMLEADVLLGTVNDSEVVPIMAHPPNVTSDLSLEEFLKQVLEYNTKSTSSKKGIKLDFKSIDVLESSVFILTNFYSKLNCPLWLNADIFPGPFNTTDTPVDPDRFLNSTKDFQNATLSIGWKTRYGGEIVNASYTDDDITTMMDFVRNNSIIQPITFPVRAGIAAQSIEQIKKLTRGVSNSTLTLWNAKEDPVNIENLRALIKRDKLHLDQLGGTTNVKPIAFMWLALTAFVCLV